MSADDLAIQNAANLHSLVADALTAPRGLDQHTLAVAEQTVRDRIKATTWKGEASALRLAADAIHKLGETS